MWTGRLSGQSGSAPPSQPGSRSYSPAPKRSVSGAGAGTGPYLTSQQRPGFTPRSSSLSIASVESSASSQVSAARKANGSGLKQSTTAYSGPDPVDVLNKLLRTAAGDDSRDQDQGQDQDTSPPTDFSPSIISAEDLTADFDFAGLSLRELALSQEPSPASESVYRAQTIEDCASPPSRHRDVLR